MDNPLTPLLEQLTKLPGIGAKSAQRLAFFLLSMSASDVATFATVLKDTRDTIRYCDDCFNISIAPKCHVCTDPNRTDSVVCVVAEPKDVFAFERLASFRPRYHVLGGLLSPIDGIHPELLRIQELIDRIKQGSVSELILGINPTIEGDATTLYLQTVLAPFQLKITKLAYGLPVGADIDYTDELTLENSLNGRTILA